MEESVLRELFAASAGSRQGLLFLDYDGTLAPFTEDRDRAVPYRGVLPRVRRIVDGGGRVVIVSGRPVDVVQRLMDFVPVEIFGCHGMERMLTTGELRRFQLSAAVRGALDEAEGCLRSMGLDDRMELKPTSVALHVRGLPVETSRAMTRSVGACWRATFDEDVAVEIHEFDGGIEMRPTARNKGSAVRTVLDDLDDDPLVAYLGDDATDEDAFEALEGRALRLLVREKPRVSRADGWIVPPLQLLQFLDLWADNFVEATRPRDTAAKL